MSIISPICGVKRAKISPKKKQNEANMKKAIYWGNRYNELVNLNYKAEDSGDYKLSRKYERQQEAAWDKYNEFRDELPIADKKKVDKIVNL